VLVVLLSVSTMPVAADINPGSGGGSNDFICDDGGLGDILSNFMFIITIVGMTAGAVIAAVNQMAASAKPGDDSYETNRNKALIGMVAVPVIVFLSPVLIEALIGVNLNCLTP
jgi:hypothetical protein